MNLFCFVDNQMKELCPPGSEPGQCANIEAEAAAYQAEKAAGRYAFPFLGAVPGGTTKAADRKVGYQKLVKDMDAYYHARKAGEQPNQVSVEAVRKNRQAQELQEKVEKRLNG